MPNDKLNNMHNIEDKKSIWYRKGESLGIAVYVVVMGMLWGTLSIFDFHMSDELAYGLATIISIVLLLGAQRYVRDWYVLYKAKEFCTKNGHQLKQYNLNNGEVLTMCDTCGKSICGRSIDCVASPEKILDLEGHEAPKGIVIVSNKAYKQQAINWINNGRQDNLLIADLPLAALSCWYGFHSYVKTPDIDPVIGEYCAACKAKQPEGWYDKVLWRREYCTGCGQTYKIENMMICTKCHEVYCFPCAGQGKHDEKGYSLCRCGGELVG